MNIFIHAGTEAPLKRIEVTPQTRVSEVVSEHGAEEGALWREGADEAAAVEQTLAEAGVGDGDRLYAGRCRKVEVTVNFNEDSKVHSMPPAATIASLLAWAVGPKGFDLPENERPKHTLIVCETEEQTDASAHVAEFTTDTCEACFDLVPKEKFEG